MEEALKAFGEEGFDVKAWVNAQVRASEALAESAGHAKGANVDDNLSTLVVKLQLMAQSASKAVDEHAQKLIMELPHAMVDIERVGADSSLLAAQMAQVLDKVSEVERTGQQTVSALATLDAVKTRMEECAQMLAEAESVSRILTQLEPLFQKDELREIAARLGSLRRSLESMGQLEGFGDAAARLKTFEDRLEKRISSKLKEGIELHDAEATKECLDVYEQMKRRDVLVTRYVQARKSNLVKIYSAFAEVKPDDEQEPLPMRLRGLAANLSAALGAELAWCESVFPDSATFAAALWVDLTSTIAAPLQSVVADALFKPGTYGEPQLLELRVLLGIVSDLGVEVSSMLRREELVGATPDAEAPFVATLVLLEKSQREYPECEAHVFERMLQGARRKIEACVSGAEVLRQMEETITATGKTLRTSSLRCMQVTGGCEGVAVTRMLDEVFESPSLVLRHSSTQAVFALLVQVLGAGMDTIRKLAKLDEPKDSGRAAGRPGGVGGAGGSNAQTEGGGEGGAGAEDDMSLIDDDDTAVLEAEDLSMMWMALQCAIGVLRLTERLPAFLADVEASLQQLILDYGPLIFGPVSLSLNLSGQERGVGNGTGGALQCRYLLGEARRMAALEKLITKAKGKDFVALVRGPSLLQGLRMRAEELLLDAALVYVKRLLADVPRMRVWNDRSKTPAHLPSFSTSPLRYVTQIAEHLFLIPDQLDPSNNEDSQTESGAGEDAGAAAAFMEEWLAKITGRVVTLYFNSILAIPALSASGQTQLSTDMQYLCSILDRLGAPGLEGLNALKALVEADVNALPQVAADSKLDRHVIDKMSRKLVR